MVEQHRKNAVGKDGFRHDFWHVRHCPWASEQEKRWRGRPITTGTALATLFLTPEDRVLSLHWQRSRSFCRMSFGVNTPNPAFSVDSHGQRAFFPMIRSQYELTHGGASRVITRQYLTKVQLLMRGFLGSPGLVKRLSLHLGLDHGPSCLTETCMHPAPKPFPPTFVSIVLQKSPHPPQPARSTLASVEV